ncbi:hypothetical protein JXL21_03965 [Candidatus Bathyarchaeota archaeon]|nr:hypothetical protein [Candidatus Bathyarchaeota archaeon]
MVDKWYELGTKSLSPGDNVVKTFKGSLNGRKGHLMLSKKKALFLEEKGFLSKSYKVSLNLQFDNVDNVSSSGSQVEICHKNGAKYVIVPEGSAIEVDGKLRELVSKSKA